MKKLLKLPVIISAIVMSDCDSASQTAPVSKATSDIPSHPLTNEQDLDILINEIGDSRIVLLGEASHGTAEYYEWRAAISKRLIQEKGFTIIGVEGEWADSYRVNQFVKGKEQNEEQAIELLRRYDRWPTWMWGNYQVGSLITWLNQHNQGLPEDQKAGFYGLDVYCLWESMEELAPYIKDNPELTRVAKEVEKCFRPHSADPSEYAYAVAYESKTCRGQTQRLYQEILKQTGGSTAKNEAEFVMQQNALVALNGENYYRTSVSEYDESWNIRDRHMTQTIGRLLELHGADSKIIVWEHNTHIGDARYTDMASAGMVNVGQLVREQYGEKNVFAVGFGSYEGTVIASDRWGGKVEAMKVPAAKKGSWEELLHREGAENKILLSKELKSNKSLLKTIGHRAIGVQYNPRAESGNYVPTVIPYRYDAFIYIDKTRALDPISMKVKNEPPDLYPSGM
ncbi:MAG TPA: erythromycin esterase family protein [Flavobacterium sp.]